MVPRRVDSSPGSRSALMFVRRQPLARGPDDRLLALFADPVVQRGARVTNMLRHLHRVRVLSCTSRSTCSSCSDCRRSRPASGRSPRRPDSSGGAPAGLPWLLAPVPTRRTWIGVGLAMATPSVPGDADADRGGSPGPHDARLVLGHHLARDGAGLHRHDGPDRRLRSSGASGRRLGISETGAELGGAIGIAVLGSIGTAVYRAALTDQLPPGIPNDAVAGARDTLGAAVEVAQELPGHSAASSSRAPPMRSSSATPTGRTGSRTRSGPSSRSPAGSRA